MKAEVQKAIEAVRDALHENCKDMSPEEYMEVLDTIAADVDGNIDALRDENPDLFN